eukprot:9082267-Alexandrium_andersonii.AAC.1
MAGRQGRCVGSPAARREAAISRNAAARVGASREQGGPSLPCRPGRPCVMCLIRAVAPVPGRVGPMAGDALARHP